MAYRKKTIREMPEVTRELAKLINEADSFQRRLKNLIPRIRGLERDSRALKQHSCAAVVQPSGNATGANVGAFIDQDT